LTCNFVITVSLGSWSTTAIVYKRERRKGKKRKGKEKEKKEKKNGRTERK
jgi:hypothetical protein